MKIKIIRKKKLEEMSSIGGGNVVGHVDDKEKEELEEMYSTSGAMMGAGSGEIPKERNPEAHKRYVRIRFLRQGLQNFKPNRYFAGKRQRFLTEAIDEDTIEEYLYQKHDVVLHKKLGAGQYGVVYSGFYDDEGVAIKILLKGISSTKREVENYEKISQLASKNQDVAKHFPKVYLIDESHPDYSFIVMEELEVDSYYQEDILTNFFGLVNTLLKTAQSAEDFPGMKFENTSNRLYVYLSDKESRNNILNRFFTDIKDKTGIDLSYLGETMKMYLSNLHYYFSSTTLDSVVPKIKALPKKLGVVASKYLYRGSSLKKEFSQSPWFLDFVLIPLSKVAKVLEDSGAWNTNTWNKISARIIGFWLDFYRKSSVIGTIGIEKGHELAKQNNLGLSQTGVSLEKWGLFEEASSLKLALLFLWRAGILATDMHRENVMFRPHTNDIVIVDVGSFMPRPK